MEAEQPSDLESLREMSRRDLLEIWEQAGLGVLPYRTSTPFLARLLAYELQVRKHGGLRKRAR